MFKLQAAMEIADQRIEDLLCCAFEGGSNYWYDITGYNYPEGETSESLGIEFTYLQLPLKGGSVTICDIETGEFLGVVNRDRVQQGLEIMSQKYPKHFNDFIEENEDADTGDVFLQCVVLGEVVYG